jgi:hypothetical protein
MEGQLVKTETQTSAGQLVTAATGNLIDPRRMQCLSRLKFYTRARESQAVSNIMSRNHLQFFCCPAD